MKVGLREIASAIFVLCAIYQMCIAEFVSEYATHQTVAILYAIFWILLALFTQVVENESD